MNFLKKDGLTIEEIKQELAAIKLPQSKSDYEKFKKMLFSRKIKSSDIIPKGLMSAFIDAYDKEYPGPYGKYD